MLEILLIMIYSKKVQLNKGPFSFLTVLARVNGPNHPEERKRYLHHLDNLRLDLFKRGRINSPSGCQLLVLNLIDLA